MSFSVSCKSGLPVQTHHVVMDFSQDWDSQSAMGLESKLVSGQHTLEMVRTSLALIYESSGGKKMMITG